MKSPSSTRLPDARAAAARQSALRLYRGFSGLNTATSEIALESPDAQALTELDNLWCSPRGYLSNERPIVQLGKERAAISHARFYASRPDAVVYAARLAGRTELRVLDRPTLAAPTWPRNVVAASSVFNRKVIFTGGGTLAPEVFNGSGWSQLTSSEAQGARYACAVSNRLVLAGYDRNPTEIIVSRVNREDVLPADEIDGENSVIKAIRVNVANLIGTADVVTGIASFESNKLAVFTSDRVLVYLAPADATQWDLDERVNINVGALSHGTIAAIGDEVFFCSRVGVHSLRRSSINGTTVFTQPLTAVVEETYRRLVAQVRDPSAISACFDRDNGRYTIFFPVNDNLTYRLAIDISPRLQEQAETIGFWSLSSFAGLTCGDSLGGFTAFGSVAGLYSLGAEYATSGLRGEGVARTPVLWHGDVLALKQSHSMILYASGAGRVVVTAENETGRELSAVVFELAAPGRADSLGVPLPQQFERPWQHSYSGLRLRVKIEQGAAQVRVFAIGVRLRET